MSLSFVILVRPDRGAEYCDEWSCLSVFTLTYLRNHAFKLHQFLCTVSPTAWRYVMCFRFCVWRHVCPIIGQTKATRVIPWCLHRRSRCGTVCLCCAAPHGTSASCVWYQVVDYAWKSSSIRLVSGCGRSMTTWPSNQRATTTDCTWPVTVATPTTLSTEAIIGIEGDQTEWSSVRRTSTTISGLTGPAPSAGNAAGGSTRVRRPLWTASEESGWISSTSQNPAPVAWCYSAMPANLKKSS